MINGIHHTAISTGNIDRLGAVYCDLLGFEVAERMSWPKGTDALDGVLGLKDSAARMVMLRAGNCFIEVFEYSSPPPKTGDPARPVCDHGYTHFCLDVTDIQAEYKRLSAGGMRFHSAPLVDPELGIAATYGRDPDGNVIEIQEMLKREHPFHSSRSRQENKDDEKKTAKA